MRLSPLRVTQSSLFTHIGDEHWCLGVGFGTEPGSQIENINQSQSTDHNHQQCLATVKHYGLTVTTTFSIRFRPFRIRLSHQAGCRIPGWRNSRGSKERYIYYVSISGRAVIISVWQEIIFIKNLVCTVISQFLYIHDDNRSVSFVELSKRCESRVVSGLKAVGDGREDTPVVRRSLQNTWQGRVEGGGGSSRDNSSPDDSSRE